VDRGGERDPPKKKAERCVKGKGQEVGKGRLGVLPSDRAPPMGRGWEKKNSDHRIFDPVSRARKSVERKNGSPKLNQTWGTKRRARKV